MPKRLALVRHAKSSWDDPGLADHDRPLNGRGRRAAVAVGRHLRETGLAPELVLCSSATRATQTLELLDLAGGGEVLVEDALYGAGAGGLLARVRAVPEAIASVLLVGHNPDLEQFAAMLVGDAGARVERFPTGAVADLALPIRTWRDLEPGTARLREFVVPRDLA